MTTKYWLGDRSPLYWCPVRMCWKCRERERERQRESGGTKCASDGTCSHSHSPPCLQLEQSLWIRIQSGPSRLPFSKQGKTKSGHPAKAVVVRLGQLELSLARTQKHEWICVWILFQFIISVLRLMTLILNLLAGSLFLSAVFVFYFSPCATTTWLLSCFPSLATYFLSHILLSLTLCA